MSSFPKRSSAAVTSRAAAASLVMSVSNAHASPPSSLIIFTVVSAEPRSRSATHTRAPSRASTTAVARPLPIVCPGVWPPPTTIAALPSTRLAITRLPAASLSDRSARQRNRYNQTARESGAALVRPKSMKHKVVSVLGLVALLAGSVGVAAAAPAHGGGHGAGAFHGSAPAH